MAKNTKQKQEKRKIDTTKPIEQACKDCGTKYTAAHVTFDNGDTLITPPRCESCQIAHAVNVRINPAVSKIKLLGNLKPRIYSEFGEEGLQAVLDALTSAVTELADRYSGTVIKKAGAFDLKTIKA